MKKKMRTITLQNGTTFAVKRGPVKLEDHQELGPHLFYFCDTCGEHSTTGVVGHRGHDLIAVLKSGGYQELV